MKIIETEKIKVYVKTDAIGNVVAVNSRIFIKEIKDWIEIDEGVGDRYAHAQGNYFEKALMNENGIYLYLYENGSVREKNSEEIQSEISAIPAMPPTEIELLRKQLKAITDRNDFIEDCMAELAMEIYQ